MTSLLKNVENGRQRTQTVEVLPVGVLPIHLDVLLVKKFPENRKNYELGLFVAQGSTRSDARGAPGGNPTSQQADSEEQGDYQRQ